MLIPIRYTSQFLLFFSIEIKYQDLWLYLYQSVYLINVLRWLNLSKLPVSEWQFPQTDEKIYNYPSDQTPDISIEPGSLCGTIYFTLNFAQWKVSVSAEYRVKWHSHDLEHLRQVRFSARVMRLPPTETILSWLNVKSLEHWYSFLLSSAVSCVTYFYPVFAWACFLSNFTLIARNLLKTNFSAWKTNDI